MRLSQILRMVLRPILSRLIRRGMNRGMPAMGAGLRPYLKADWVILALGLAALTMGALAVANMGPTPQMTLADVAPALPST